MMPTGRRATFLLGNLLLGAALVVLIFLGTLWTYLGVWTMVLWIVLAGVGMTLVVSDKGNPDLPD
jgi:hypothetical protein